MATNTKSTLTGGKVYAPEGGWSKVKPTVVGINAGSNMDSPVYMAEYRMGTTGSPDDQTFRPFGTTGMASK